ncbi:hypothetical protein QUB10_23345 [Microcoleus sp. B5-D4]|uniref:hypothetical protein n=1 Tax=unclassified Microcoleus TaxID=2642155 RepID=UPI002FCE6C76
MTEQCQSQVEPIESAYNSRSLDCLLHAIGSTCLYATTDAGSILRKERGFGLVGMWQRVEQIGAQLEIQSELGSGTKVIIGHICSEHPFVKTYQNRDKAMNSFLA